MGNIAVCKKCKRWFDDSYSKDYCFNCRREVNHILDDVKSYIKENSAQPIGIMDVSEKFKIPIPQIISWINQGELELRKDFDTGCSCRKCGAIILEGNFCEKCKKSLVNGLAGNNNSSNNISRPQTYNKDNPKMRYLSKK